MTAPLLGRPEAAMLLAVERANGGELSGLEQVLVAFDTLFERQMAPDSYAGSCARLCEAGLVEYLDGSLGLTVAGRKLLRHTSVPGNPGRPHQVAEQLAQLEEEDLAEPGSVPTPAARAFETASEALGSDTEEGSEPLLGSDLAPQVANDLGWGPHGPFASARMVFNPQERAAQAREGRLPVVPLVAPAEDDRGDLGT